MARSGGSWACRRPPPARSCTGRWRSCGGRAMRMADPLEPEVEAALEAIDATLAGDPVDPEHPELARLARILRADRPRVGEPFAVAMDARARERFSVASGRRPRTPLRLRRPARGWI